MGTSGIITTANPNGGSHAALLQKQMSFKTSVGANQLLKTDDIEVIESVQIDASTGRYNKVIFKMYFKNTFKQILLE